MQMTRREGLAALLAAAAVGLPRVSRGDEAEITIGAPNSLTGGTGELGQRYAWGVLLAADDINRNGGIKSLGGAKLKVVVADTSSENATQAASVARRMIDQDQAIALAGATASAMTLAAQIEAEKSGIPLVTASWADPVVERGMKNTFKVTLKASTAWDFVMQAVVDLMKANNRAPKSIGIYTGSEAVSLTLAKTLPPKAKELGIGDVSAVSYQGNLSDPTVILAPLRQNKPDLVVLTGFYNDLVLVLQAMRGLGITTPVISGGGTNLDSAGQALGKAATGIFMPMHWLWDLKSAQSSALVESYKKAHSDAHFPPNNEWLATGYASVQILGQALEKAQSRETAKIRDALATTEFTDLILPGGKARFDDKGLNTYAQGIIGEWMNPDEIRTVWPKEFQTVQPVI